MTEIYDLRFSELVERIDHVRSLARTLVRDAVEADEVVAEALRRAVSGSGGLARASDGWLRVVLRNIARDRTREEARRRRREREAAREESLPDASETAVRLERDREVVEEVLALKSPYREAILLRYFEDLRPAQIAARTGCSVEATAKHLQRGKAELRRRLESRYGGRGAWAVALLPAVGDPRALGLERGVPLAKVVAALGVAVLGGWGALALAGSGGWTERSGAGGLQQDPVRTAVGGLALQDEVDDGRPAPAEEVERPPVAAGPAPVLEVFEGRIRPLRVLEGIPGHAVAAAWTEDVGTLRGWIDEHPLAALAGELGPLLSRTGLERDGLLFGRFQGLAGAASLGAVWPELGTWLARADGPAAAYGVHPARSDAASVLLLSCPLEAEELRQLVRPGFDGDPEAERRMEGALEVHAGRRFRGEGTWIGGHRAAIAGAGWLVLIEGKRLETVQLEVERGLRWLRGHRLPSETLAERPEVAALGGVADASLEVFARFEQRPWERAPKLLAEDELPATWAWGARWLRGGVAPGPGSEVELELVVGLEEGSALSEIAAQLGPLPLGLMACVPADFRTATAFHWDAAGWLESSPERDAEQLRAAALEALQILNSVTEPDLRDDLLSVFSGVGVRAREAGSAEASWLIQLEDGEGILGALESVVRQFVPGVRWDSHGGAWPQLCSASVDGDGAVWIGADREEPGWLAVSSNAGRAAELLEQARDPSSEAAPSEWVPEEFSAASILSVAPAADALVSALGGLEWLASAQDSSDVRSASAAVVSGMAERLEGTLTQGLEAGSDRIIYRLRLR